MASPLSPRAAAITAARPGGAAALDSLRAVLCGLPDAAGPGMRARGREGGSTRTIDAPPARKARGEILPWAGGWRIRVELPGAPPETVALAMRRGMLLVHASGPCRYEARLPLPPAADPGSLRWHCAHGLLEGCLARQGAEDGGE